MTRTANRPPGSQFARLRTLVREVAVPAWREARACLEDDFVDAAIAVADEEADRRLRGIVTSVIDDEARYRKMVEAMRGLGRPYAAEDVVRLIEEAARQH